MTGSDPNGLLAVGPGLAVALVALALTGAAVARLGRTGYGPAILGSAARAVVQLAALGMALSLIVRSLWFTAAFVALMGGTAGWTAARRIAVIPVAGSAIGAAMAGAGLAGKRALEELLARRGELEAGLALGLEPRFARLDLARDAAATALIPALDQTRTVGLVTIPGAFVGMVLGGAPPRWPRRSCSCTCWSRSSA